MIEEKRSGRLRGKSVDYLERALDKILEWFFAYPEEETGLTELCSSIGISKSNGSTIIENLHKEGLLEIRTFGRVWRIKLNREHTSFLKRKIPSNLKHVYESGIIEWIQEHHPEGRAIILFGSYRKGDDISTSDVDIAVEVLGRKTLDIQSLLIQSLGYRKNVPCSIHFFSRKTVDLNLFANIANGIVLYGFLEVKK